MKRWVAAIFLMVIAFYLAGQTVDRCGDNPNEEAQICHILCSDGCATAPIPKPPTAPPPDPLPRPSFEAERAEHLTTLTVEPEKEPPRV